MRTLRLLLAVGLSLAPTLAATAAGTTPAYAGGGAGMTLTATMDGQDQRLLVGTKHLVRITLADTPGEADLRDISITLKDLDPRPIPVTCPTGQDGQLSLEPNGSLQCTAMVTAAVGYRTLVARARAYVPSLGNLLRTDPLHYDGFMPPPPPPKPATVPVHGPLAPDPASGRPRPPVFIAPPPPPRFAAPKPADPPDPPAAAAGGSCAGGAGGANSAGGSGCCGAAATGGGSGCCSGGAGSGAASGCCGAAGGSANASACCGAAAASACCGSGHMAAGGKDCCGSGHMAAGNKGCCGATGKSGACAKHDGLAFTGMSTPTLATAAGGGLLLMAGGLVLVRRFGRR
ncbi:hypothetical protein KGQ20_28985 [Catenulispora sp. NF23]|uniref:Gram-positive cocci surface proteins LPxTG domain-containing protein n=1 Tax=Catenulispora pinistramenti TaxID=2705254 RepID=A0ABS5L4H3_9ACTN|nr:hypothetical protein [Catenulispora pinistramenti]MBS2536805.1 hypothetical protein [Catenulispora pinistramenti]MBS2553005.1 hypothetical protein [Catenulispora pinistramenti]